MAHILLQYKNTWQTTYQLLQAVARDSQCVTVTAYVQHDQPEHRPSENLRLSGQHSNTETNHSVNRASHTNII